MGNHHVSGPYLGQKVASEEFEILHFPMRTYEQFENKIMKGGRALAANTELPPGKGRTWRELYALWQKGGLCKFYEAEVVDAAELSMRYVEDTKLRDFVARLDTAASVGLVAGE